MITLLHPKRMPVAIGVCLRFTACVQRKEFDSRVDGAGNIIVRPCVAAFFSVWVSLRAGLRCKLRQRDEARQQGVECIGRRTGRNMIMHLCTKACVCAHHCTPACFMPPCCSGYSICQANLNDLVESEMRHKGALMDEGEHSATVHPRDRTLV